MKRLDVFILGGLKASLCFVGVVILYMKLSLGFHSNGISRI